MAFIDFFPFFGAWTLHHQVDWLLAKQINSSSSKLTSRVFSCSHQGRLACAISRQFIPEAAGCSHTCTVCTRDFQSYFAGFTRALKLVSDQSHNLHDLSLDDIFRIAWNISDDKELGLAMDHLYEDLMSLSKLSAMTHFRISKLDIESSRRDLIDYFAKTILVEAVNIAYNWSISRPESIVLFNGRLAPYIAPYFLAAHLKIPTYVHERGIRKPFSMFFNEYPSTGLYAKSLINRMHESESDMSRVSDKQLLECIQGRANEVRCPSNYPNLFDSGVDSSTKRMQAGEGHEVVYVVSSEDEADSYPESNLALAQRSAITSLIEASKLFPQLSFAIKSHPNIYGVKGYPGMELSARFMDEIETLCGTIDNIVVYGRNIHIDPFALVRQSMVVLGLHSSLLEFAWLNGKYIITHSNTESSAYASTVVDFLDPKGILLPLEDFANNAELKWKSKIDSATLNYLIAKTYGFDIDLGNDIEIGPDHFSPKKRIGDLSRMKIDEGLGDLPTVLSSVTEGRDINLELIQQRLGSEYGFN